MNLLLVAAVFFSFTHEFRANLPGDTGVRRKPAALRQASSALINGNIVNTVNIANTVNGAEDTDSISEYSLIGGQNLFHPDRMIPVPKPAAVVIQPPPKPVLVLHGTLIADDLTLAYIEVQTGGTAYGRPPVPRHYVYNGQPQPNPSGKKIGTYRKGDSIDGFVITSIEPDKVVLARGAETMEIYLSTPVTDMSGTNYTPPNQPAFMPPTAPHPPFR